MAQVYKRIAHSQDIHFIHKFGLLKEPEQGQLIKKKILLEFLLNPFVAEQQQRTIY